MARVTIVLEDRPDGSVATMTDVEGEPTEGGSLSAALVYGMTFRALQDTEIIDTYAVEVMMAASEGRQPSDAIMALEEARSV